MSIVSAQVPISDEVLNRIDVALESTRTAMGRNYYLEGREARSRPATYGKVLENDIARGQ